MYIIHDGNKHKKVTKINRLKYFGVTACLVFSCSVFSIRTGSIASGHCETKVLYTFNAQKISRDY